MNISENMRILSKLHRCKLKIPAGKQGFYMFKILMENNSFLDRLQSGIQGRWAVILVAG